MTPPPTDGTLEDWSSIVPSFTQAALLCGNGLSINVWPDFAYTSLFSHARKDSLTEEDRALLLARRTSSSYSAISVLLFA
jgi:hypothetical protein